jgi:hypothetical protein
MKITHLFASLFIIGCTTFAWFCLGGALAQRTQESSNQLREEVSGVWGPTLTQQHPQAWFETPNAPNGRAMVLAKSSQVNVKLESKPKRRGLLWHRTYDVDFQADYVFTNPTKIPQTFYISFPLPGNTAGLNGFQFRLGDKADSPQSTPSAGGVVTQAILLPEMGSVTLHTAYRTRGTNWWKYHFPDNRRIEGFNLLMKTDFAEIDFPVGTGSPSQRKQDGEGYTLRWDYPDVLAAPSIGMDMPKRLNAGPIAARIAFFAPVSLLFFVTVVLLIGGIKAIPLHPMHVFFISAGFFAFHLLFAYLVDLLPLVPSSIISTITSLLLVSGYLKAVGGSALFRISLAAQTVYLIVFSASFFMDGLTGITLAVMSVMTLALLMVLTARIDWKTFFVPKPPPLPA